jgi:hypothetical protein
MHRKIVALLVALTTTSSALAQDWDWKVAPYLWAAGIEGDVALGPVAREVDVEFSDLLHVLAGAALVHVEGSKGDHGVFGDLVWMSLEPEDEIATLGGVTEASFDTTILELGYVRELSKLSVELGVRYWDFELELDPALLPAVERADDWVDGFIGIRRSSSIGDKWSSTTSFDIGAGGSDFTWAFDLVYSRELKGGNRFATGLKVLDIDYENASVNGLRFAQDLTFLGATVGYVFD